MKYSYLYGAEGNPIAYSVGTYRDKTRFVIAAFLSCVAVFVIVASQLSHVRSNTVQALPDSTQVSVVEQSSPVPQASDVKSVAAPPVVDKTLTKIDISGWLLSHKGSYSISVYDQEGNPLIDANSNEHYFMASIYKLYVAYIGYQKLDEGAWLDDANYLDDMSRTKCLDEMIRSSHSPCGEKIMAEIGKTNVQAKLDEYGLENTSFKEFETSSADVTNVLIRLQKGLDLSPASRQKMMDSMLGQTYRDALAKGFGDWKTYDKVGFREQNEYHDVGIVVNPEGKWYVVSVLTNRAGTNNIADLAHTIRTSME
jgi:beta-lactamase class A